MKIQDSVVWITGGTSGIGEGTAEYLVGKGAKVVISGRNVEKGNAIASRLGENCYFVKCDVKNLDEIKAAAQEVVDHFGRMDVVCTFAGAPHVHSIFDSEGNLEPNDMFREDIATNLTGSYDAARVAAWHMKNNEGGEFGEKGLIVLCGSLASVSGVSGPLPGYKSAKEGVKGLTRVFACELAPYGIRCNSVLPGWVESGITTNPSTNLGMDISQDMQSQCFPKPVGQPVYIAMMVGQFIENPYLNKVDVSVDAGELSRY